MRGLYFSAATASVYSRVQPTSCPQIAANPARRRACPYTRSAPRRKAVVVVIGSQESGRAGGGPRLRHGLKICTALGL